MLAQGGGRSHQARAVAATGCTPHMSWSPCVRARISSVCPRHAHGYAMVPPWCCQCFSLVLPPLNHLPPSPLKEQYESFSLFMEETSICLRRHNGILNKYKKFQLSLHLHHISLVHVWCPSGAHAVRARCLSGSPAVRIWPARGMRLALPWSPHLTFGV